MEDILGEKDHTDISVMATFHEQITRLARKPRLGGRQEWLARVHSWRCRTIQVGPPDMVYLVLVF